MRMHLMTAVAIATALFVGTEPAMAGSSVNEANGDTLVLSTDANGVVDNILAAPPADFNFSGLTGQLSSVTSSKGYFYADYLLDVTASSAESVTTTLTNKASNGVQGLTSRIYAYTGSFLGDAASAPNTIQGWGTTTIVPGASVSYIAPTTLSTGKYVLEIRGSNAGNFGGDISLSPVPEPTESALLAIGAMALVGVAGMRRRVA